MTHIEETIQNGNDIFDIDTLIARAEAYEKQISDRQKKREKMLALASKRNPYACLVVGLLGIELNHNVPSEEDIRFLEDAFMELNRCDIGIMLTDYALRFSIPPSEETINRLREMGLLDPEQVDRLKRKG